MLFASKVSSRQDNDNYRYCSPRCPYYRRIFPSWYETNECYSRSRPIGNLHAEMQSHVLECRRVQAPLALVPGSASRASTHTSAANKFSLGFNRRGAE